MQIELKHLKKQYKELLAVNDVNLTINPNQIFALLGVNGAGKTTTIKMMTGLICVDEGQILYGDLSVKKDLAKIKQFINVSPQETAIAGNLTVQENLNFIARIYGFNKKEALIKTQEILEKFELLEVKNKLAKKLSGGMQRRLSIACALISQPKVLFLDEPTLGLDVIARANLWKLIKSLKKDMTVILTTHYMEEAEQLADSVAIMDNGKIIYTDTPMNILAKTQSSNLEQAFIKIIQEKNL